MAGIGGNHGGVLSLESLASDVFLKEFVYKTTSETVEAVRESIDQILIGKVKKNARESWADSFCQSYGKYLTSREMEHFPSLKCAPDGFAVLDCILDEHFQGLAVSLPFPAHKSFSALVSILTHRCPKLQALQVAFRYKVGSYEAREDNCTEPEPITPGSCLSYLKSLTLYWMEWEGTISTLEYWRKSIYSIVGKHCTSLTKLEIGGGIAARELGTIMPLLVNRDVVDILFSRNERRWNQNLLLGDFLIPSEFLNPLCFTLKGLSLSLSSSYGRRPPQQAELQLSISAFVLRYLTKLECVSFGRESTIDVVEHLYKTFQHIQNKEFEKACIQTASRIGLPITSPLTFIEKPILLLKKLVDVPINDAVTLLAATSLCPYLEKVNFVHTPSQNPISPATLGTILESWSKIEKMRIAISDPDSLQIVLESLGSNLRKLHVDGRYLDGRVSLAKLATVCTQLEDLTFESCSFNDSEADASNWTPDTFFPLLTHFRSYHNSCLGALTSLIERKSTLVSLSLDCCHIGTNANNPRLEWSHISKCWSSNLQRFIVRYCSGLTLAMVAELIPQLNNLRCISLPYSIVSQNSELAHRMGQDFARREKRVLVFRATLPNHELSICPFQFT